MERNLNEYVEHYASSTPPTIDPTLKQNSKNSCLQAAWIVSVIFMGLNALCVIGIIALVAIADPIVLDVITDQVVIDKIYLWTIAVMWLIPFAWQIPMTIMMKRCADGKRKKSLALSICTILFCNIVSGILLLVAE